MTDSGSGQRDDQGQPTPPGSDHPGPDDDYTPSASWETSRGSSWENTTPYESPYARPDSSGSASGYGSSAASYESVSGSESTSPYGQDRGDQTGSAAEPAAEDGPWPTYPDQAQGGYGPSQPGYGQPPSYQQPTSYGSASDPYAQSGSGPHGPYGQQPGYGEQAPYGQPAQEQYGQPPGYPAQPGYGVNPYQQPVYAGYVLPNHPQATTALILGIVGLALCPFVGIAGFVMGGRVRARSTQPRSVGRTRSGHGRLGARHHLDRLCGPAGRLLRRHDRGRDRLQRLSPVTSNQPSHLEPDKDDHDEPASLQ